MPVNAVLEALPAGASQVLLHRQRVDIAESPVLEVAGRGVMQGVRLLPVVVRRQREHAQDGADGVRQPGRSEEGGVPAIMLDNEKPHQGECGWSGEFFY